MCGIAGIISIKNILDSDHIINMTDIIEYRGPDDYGYLAGHSDRNKFIPFKDKFKNNAEYNFYLGHRRLSILDLSSLGHQPMSDANGICWIVYNGEIYNYNEIRKELKKIFIQ